MHFELCAQSRLGCSERSLNRNTNIVPPKQTIESSAGLLVLGRPVSLPCPAPVSHTLSCIRVNCPTDEVFRLCLPTATIPLPCSSAWGPLARQPTQGSIYWLCSSVRWILWALRPASLCLRCFSGSMARSTMEDKTWDETSADWPVHYCWTRGSRLEGGLSSAVSPRPSLCSGIPAHRE
ncbi:hypothetical protein GY45DRAFT_942689 [Cubamyces sp. BRFM 1775]|nr:hypothetical protein GY45DRAFT_942689 [Cubamyces sp. BRFM 1775]